MLYPRMHTQKCSMLSASLCDYGSILAFRACLLGHISDEEAYQANSNLFKLDSFAARRSTTLILSSSLASE